MFELNMEKEWYILQDVYDLGEKIELYKAGFDNTVIYHQMSEWEPIDRLGHLQTLLSDSPYSGRELRYFNQSP